MNVQGDRNVVQYAKLNLPSEDRSISIHTDSRHRLAKTRTWSHVVTAVTILHDFEKTRLHPLEPKGQKIRIQCNYW